MGILCVLNTQAELKHFLPRTNACMSILNCKYWFEGDTIIDSKRYTKVYQQYCYSKTECDDHLYYYAAVREDTIGAKIYGLFPCSDSSWDDCSEKLLADFDVKTGDEVMVRSAWFASQLPAFVESIDSIEINGEYRKRINLRGEGSAFSYPPDVWVEGMGSVVYGLFFPNPEHVADAGDPPVFLCLHENDKLIYQNPDYEVCYLEPWKDPEEEFLNKVSECRRNTGHSFGACVYYLLHGSSLESFEKFERLVEDCLANNPDKMRENCESDCAWGLYTGQLETIIHDKIRIFPNPADHSVFVESNDLAFSYTLYDMQGYSVKSGTITHSKIDISDLNDNWYFLVLYDNNKEVVSFNKLIKR